jgi:hypothetical protein
MNPSSVSAFIWSVADLLRGDYKQADYGKVILPFTLLRRLDCVLEATKPAVLKEYEARRKSKLPLHDFLVRKAKQSFYNTSPLDFPKLLADPANIRKNLVAYIGAYSDSARDIFDRYDFQKQIDKLDESNLLYQVVEKFAKVDLHPNVLSNADMGLAFEELIRRFAELSNETAGEHYTPREVIRLMVDLLFIADNDALTKPGVVRSIYDPTAGTGGMLSIAEEYLRRLNPDARLVVYGQELNAESYAICKADMLVKGQDVSNIVFGNTLSQRRACGQDVRLRARESTVRGGMEEGGEAGPRRVRGEGLPRPLRCRFAARVGRLAAVPHASALEDAPPKRGWWSHRHRVERLAAIHRRRGLGRVGHPQVDHRERLAGGHRRATHRHVLQHRYLDLCLDFDQPQAP